MWKKIEEKKIYKKILFKSEIETRKIQPIKPRKLLLKSVWKERKKIIIFTYYLVEKEIIVKSIVCSSFI